MKTIILAALAALSLGIAVANAEPVNQAVPQQNTNQFNLTAGAAGWG